MTAPNGLRFLVDLRDLRNTRVADCPDAPAPLPEGSVRLHIERFALTANNITYAAFGNAMHYWDFFPSGEAGWGCIPVWGFAEVVESRCEGVAVGERLYAYLPMASHLVVQPTRLDAHGFLDATPHRRELPVVYNRLSRCSADPLYHPGNEGAQAVLRPLFITSFLIDDFLIEQQAFGAKRVLLSSASSKTAYGTAFCLSLRRSTPEAVEVVGLTSARNVAFVRDSGLYDRVLPYDEIETLDPGEPAVFVDFAGDAALRSRIHGHWRDALAYSCSVGGTHWDHLGSGAGLPGPRPTLFFAPSHVQRRAAPPPEGWGQEGLQLRLARAWSAFVERALAGRPPLLRIVEEQGAAAVTRRYLDLLDGRADPAEGCVLSI